MNALEIKNYPVEVLNYIDSLTDRTEFTAVEVFNNKNECLARIEGDATGGTLSLTNQSSVRRTGSLNLLVPEYERGMYGMDIMHEVTNMETLISMNKIVRVWKGIENTELAFTTFNADGAIKKELWSQDKIFWFNMGTYLLSNASVTYNNQGIQVSMKLNDPMARLNGEAGGTIASKVQHSPIDTEELKEGKIVIDSTLPTTQTIVKTVLNDFGNLNLSYWDDLSDNEQKQKEKDNYDVVDIPENYKAVVHWAGDYDIMIHKESGQWQIAKAPNSIPTDWIKIPAGGYMGYMTKPFVYPTKSESPFTSEAGSTVSAVLDTIKNTLGNYEHFFTPEGKYRFQPIQNYVTKGMPQDDITEALDAKYFYTPAEDLQIYSLQDAKIITAYTNAPQYNQIKNDFMVIGKHPELELPLRYHVTLERRIPANEKRHWTIKWAKDDKDIARVYSAKEGGATDCGDNYRLKKYLQIIAENDQTAFGKEIREEFPKMFDIENMKWRFDPTSSARDSLLYWFDIIDSRSIAGDIGQFGVETIGRRTKVISDDQVNCLFTSYMPERDLYTEDQWIFGEYKDGKFIQYNKDSEEGKKAIDAIDSKIGIGITRIPAEDYIRASLHQYLSYNENITINAVPIYHLDVNQLIYVENNESDIQGNYIIDSISYPLNFDGLMTINARKMMTMV